MAVRASIIALCGSWLAAQLLTCRSEPGGAASASGAGAAGGLNLVATGPDPGCAGAAPTSDAGGASADPACAGSEPVSFSHDVRPIFARCSGENCHVPPTFASIVRQRSSECCDGRLLVAPLHPSASYLVDKIRGRNLCRGGEMPLDNPPLGAAQIATIIAWVCQGAANN